ncbi:MAG TPA: PadR family transcriptional regulator, partial [Longimicrobiales bacterium]|nr:PadR family transcriptional regulator [Longimicrobiales bacterium]
LGMSTTRVLASLRDGPLYGLDVVDATGLPSGTVYPTLGRLEKRGLVRARWENPKLAEEEGRPRRRYYRLTADGKEALREALERFREQAAALGVLEPEPGGEEA